MSQVFVFFTPFLVRAFVLSMLSLRPHEKFRPFPPLGYDSLLPIFGVVPVPSRHLRTPPLTIALISLSGCQLDYHWPRSPFFRKCRSSGE